MIEWAKDASTGLKQSHSQSYAHKDFTPTIPETHMAAQLKNLSSRGCCK